MSEKTCDVCGAKYILAEHSIMMRDKDTIECNYCGNTLISWNGGCYYTDEEISGPIKEYQKKS